MKIPSSERQKTWRAKQRDKKKKQVTLFLTRTAHEKLSMQSREAGENYSTIIDSLILNQSESADPFSVVLKRRYRRIQELLVHVAKEPRIDDQRLEMEIEARISAEKMLKESEEKFRFLVENSHDVIYMADLEKKCFEYVSPSAREIWGYSPAEFVGLSYRKAIKRFIYPDDIYRFREHFSPASMRKKPQRDVSFEHRFKHKTLGYRWMSNTYTLMADEGGKPTVLIGSSRDIQNRKLAEMELEVIQSELEQMVTDRTASLDEANRALSLMLKKENELKAEIEQKISHNVKELVFPYLERLKSLQSTVKGNKYLDILESNLNDILSPFIRGLSSKLLNLSPGEIQVASLIKHGKTTKEIAELLNLSDRTIEFHRANIRKKAGIKNKKTSLRSFLQSIS